MGLKAAVQALKKAEELKARVSRHNDLLNNSEVWSDQQQLQTVYHQVLVLDLEYALDKKVEQELWTLGFKNHIAALQHLSRDKKNPRRSEYQALLSWCLEAASGFYLTLLQELCSTFELDLPFRRRSAIYGQTKPWPNSEQLMQPHRTSCLYICQYCLVHLGDIARYRSQRKQAESFYRHAILLSPSSGQPYNQLALLEASRGDKLATVFHYVRSISVKYPFPAAATNLSNTFSALIDNEEPHTEVHSKISQTDFILIFLKAHGLLHSVVDLNQAELYVKILNATFTALVATQVFSAAKLIQMTTINMYALTHTTDSLSTNQLSKDEIRVKHLVLELLAGALSAYLLPIYTINDNSILQDYYALPAIKLTLDWIKNNPTVLSDIVFIKRLQLWPSLCKLLNTLQDHIGDLNINKYNKIPLPEDRDLQCFLPLLNSFKDLDFTSDNLSQEVAVYNKLRISRLVSLGEWLCTQSVNNSVLMTSRKVPNTKTIWFEPEKKQPDPTTELLEELKFFNIHENQLIPPKEVTLQSYKVSSKGIEKRGGILKPQGSLEKSREEREQALLLTSLENDNSSCNTSLSNNSTGSVRSDSSKSKRTRQNIAMQALAKKVEENNKQVTFQTEPIIKTIDKLKTHETNKLISDIPKEMIKPPGSSFQPTNAAVNNSCSNIISNELAPNHCFQSPNNPVKVPIPCNQNISQNINQSLNQNITQSFQRPNISMGNIPFTVQQYSNTSSNLLYPNNIQQPSNMQYSRQQNINVPASNTLNQKNSNLPYNIGFERNTSTQPVGYQTSSFQMAPKEPFASWTLDEKLPLPPSTWWSNNQKNLPLRSYASGEQETFKPPLSYNMNSINNSNMSFVQESLKPNNMDFNMQYNTNTAGNTSGYSNVSLWNSAANIHSNIQMLLNQSGPPLIQSTESNQISSCTNVNKAQSVIRDTNNTQGFRELHTNNQTNSMPGYSLFNSNWSPNLVHSALHNSASDRPLMRQQSLFSGPGPSPLERLLEQQKQMRGGNKEDS